MCPQAPAAPPPGFISSYWTDDQIFFSLDQIHRGSPIPDDVIDDNPYQYDPSNLPDGTWFFARSTEKKVSEHGFWKAKGEACEIFADSNICGWRTTFVFHKVQAPVGEKTVWMMQEYKITQKGEHDQTKSKESALCRIFCCCDANLNNDVKPEQRDDDLDTLLRGFVGMDNDHSIAEPQVEIQNEEIELALDKLRDASDDEKVDQTDCILRGDFIELDDLADVASHSSSSVNSGRQSLASDEYFDVLELFDLDDEKNPDVEGKGSTSNSNYNIMMCRIANDVQPASLESLVGGNGGTSKDAELVPAIKVEFTPSPDQPAKRLKAEHKNEGPSSSSRAILSSSSSDEPAARREEKRKKKLMKFLCFMPF